MSVMIVQDDTFKKVASTLFAPHHWRVQSFLDSYAERNLWQSRWKGIVEEIEKLRVANYISYEQAYKEKVERFPIEYSGEEDPCKHLPELLKALECIRYQIELKDFDDTFVRELIETIKDAIIEDLPEYKDAPWG